MKAIANCINNSFEIVENVNSKDLENKFVIKDETTYVLSLLIINKIILLERYNVNSKLLKYSPKIYKGLKERISIKKIGKKVFTGEERSKWS